MPIFIRLLAYRITPAAFVNINITLLLFAKILLSSNLAGLYKCFLME
jgi:hypothetical protein